MFYYYDIGSWVNKKIYTHFIDNIVSDLFLWSIVQTIILIIILIIFIQVDIDYTLFKLSIIIFLANLSFNIVTSKVYIKNSNNDDFNMTDVPETLVIGNKEDDIYSPDFLK
jgi:hypothetical protein